MSVDLQGDGEIIKRVIAGETEMFALLIDKYERLVFSYLLPQVRNIQEVEDIAQESFLKAFRHLASFDISRRFPAWLLRIARNVMIDRLRQSNVVPLGDDLNSFILARAFPAKQSDPQTKAESREDFREIFVNIFQLPQDLKIPLLLRVIEGLSYEEIAETLELPLQTVKNRIFKARRALREKRDISNDVQI